ncbi:MAG: RNA polymerase sigma factor, partial [Oscillospiraceae bacterium]|nr:RNA polymerase sigma factor [Oscillospiraceae bacterium]
MDVQELYQTHKSMVYHLALSYMKSRPDAEDICQSVFLKLMERRKSICPGKERAWLAAVTANLCRDQLRAAKRRRTEPLTEELTFE